VSRRGARIRPGQVWVSRRPETRTPSRRVISVIGMDFSADAGGGSDVRICYSTGSEKTRWCAVRAFRLWIRRYRAVATRTRRPRSLVLRKDINR